MKRIDMTGQVFGSQHVEGPAGVDKHGQALWLTACECGTRRAAQGAKLRNGESTSCVGAGREWVKGMPEDAPTNCSYY